MTALSITATQVLPGSNATRVSGVAGETITAGKSVVRDPTTRKFVMSDADSATASLRAVDGIALNGASLDQPIEVQTAGDITIGAAATMTVGEVYVGGATAGAIAPVGDLAMGWYVSVIGVAISASVLRMGITNSGVAVPGS